MIDAILCLGAAVAVAASWGLLMIGIGTIIQRCRKAQKNKTIKANGGKQMNDIKAGYRVVVVEESGFTPPNGTVGTVVSVRDEPASICVNFDNVGYNWWVPAEYLELAQTQKQTECKNSKLENELPFAPGDKVRYTGDGDGKIYPKRGTVGEVVRIARDGTTKVHWPCDADLFNGVECEWWASNKNLELVHDEIHVGDIVRLKNTKETLAFHEEHPSWYPKQSVVGRVVGIEQDMARVEWEAGSVERNSSGGFAWYIAQKRLRVVFAKK